MTYRATATINGIRAVGTAARWDYFKQYCCEEVNPRDLPAVDRRGTSVGVCGRGGHGRGDKMPEGGERKGTHAPFPTLMTRGEDPRPNSRFIRKNRGAAAMRFDIGSLGDFSRCTLYTHSVDR